MFGMAPHAWLLLLLIAGIAEAANVPPTIDLVPAQTLVEDQAAVIVMVGGIGPGSPAEAWQTLTVSARSDAPSMCAVELVWIGGPNAVLRLIPQLDQFGSTVVHVTVRDDGGGNDTTELAIPVQITAVEDPPTCTVPAEWTIAEDQSVTDPHSWLLVSHLSGGPANEGGGQVDCIAYSTDLDRLHISNPTRSADNTAVTFTLESQPDATGDVDVIIYLRDQALTEAYRHVMVHITPVNDAPRIILTPMTVARGGSLLLDPSELNVTDADGPPASDLQMMLTAAPTHGILRNGGVALAAGATFTLADLAAGRISYVHDGSADIPEVFSLVASDGIAAPGDPVQVGIQILGHVHPFVAIPPVTGLNRSSWPPNLASQGVVHAGDSPSFAGGYLQALNLTAEVDDHLYIDDQGSGSGQIGNANGVITYAGVVIGNVTGGQTNTPLQVLLHGAAADATAVQALLRAVCLRNDGFDPSPAARRIQIVVDDGHIGASVAAEVRMPIPATDDWPRFPAGTRLATLPGLSRTFLLGAQDPDRTLTVTTWSVVTQPTNARITILDASISGGPLVRIDPIVPGPGVVSLVQTFTGITSAPIDLPVEVGSLDEARPHPCGELPREAQVGETVSVLIPWDTRDLGAIATLSYTAAGTIPDGLQLTDMHDGRVQVTLPIPPTSVAGTALRFLLIAEDRTRGFPGFLPVNLIIRAPPAGGG